MVENVRIIGLTGGIGTGKSTAAEYLKKRGFAHIDADRISRDMTKDKSPILPVLDSIFGPAGEFGVEGIEIIRSDGSLDRKALASIVFTDMNKKQRLDEVMFKAIIAEVDKQAYELAAQNPPAVIIDAPLLFEAGLDDRCDIVLLIVADPDIRVHRVCARDGISRQEVLDRINSQMSDEEKRLKSHVVIDNSGTKAELEEKLAKFVSEFYGEK